MAFWKHVLSAAGPRRFIGAFGGMFVVLGLVRAIFQFNQGAPIGSVLIVTLLIVAPGLALVYGAYWLSQSDIHAEFYPTVAGWCLIGFSAIATILLVYHVQPEGGISSPQTSLPILIVLSSVAGFGVGIHDGQAKTRTRELEQRNRELQQIRAELEETVTRLEKSNERLEQFAYAASHDLQEPLRMVSSYLRLIEKRYEDNLDEGGKEFLEFAVDGADRMRAMIEGLLQYSRVETQGKPLEPVELTAIFDDVQEDLQAKIRGTDTRITVDSLPPIEGDYNQLRQVFQNLLDNAIEYSGDETPDIHVSAERNSTEWTISVHDEGIGIEPADQEKIFEVFQRGHSRSEFDGSGVGLALCERIIERHGGEIWVESEPSEGTTFSFTLSAVDDDTG